MGGASHILATGMPANSNAPTPPRPPRPNTGGGSSGNSGSGY